jgi:hypothetical protein
MDLSAHTRFPVALLRPLGHLSENDQGYRPFGEGPPEGGPSFGLGGDYIESRWATSYLVTEVRVPGVSPGSMLLRISSPWR